MEHRHLIKTNFLTLILNFFDRRAFHSLLGVTEPKWSSSIKFALVKNQSFPINFMHGLSELKSDSKFKGSKLAAFSFNMRCVCVNWSIHLDIMMRSLFKLVTLETRCHTQNKCPNMGSLCMENFKDLVSSFSFVIIWDIRFYLTVYHTYIVGSALYTEIEMYLKRPSNHVHRNTGNYIHSFVKVHNWSHEIHYISYKIMTHWSHEDTFIALLWMNRCIVLQNWKTSRIRGRVSIMNKYP